MRSGLVGRADELLRGRAALEKLGVVVLTGPSGVGKTALCDALASEWPGPVYELRGIHGLRDVPFGALTLALRIEAGESKAETLAKVVGRLTSEGERPLVVADDAQLLDDLSAGLVSGLAQTSDVALALAVTSGEVVSPDITSVWARWSEARLEVRPLTVDDVGALLRSLVDRPLSDEEVAEIAAVSLGYPLWVSAIAAELADVGNGVGDAVRGGPESDRLTSLMERRLARLPRDSRRLFDMVAFAESTPADLVVSAHGEALLDGLRRTGLVRATGDRVQVSHPLLGSVARSTLTQEGQQSCARRLVAGLGAETDPADVVAVVRKAVAVGVVPDPALVRQAAEVAFSWSDYEGVSQLTSLHPEDPGLVALRAQAGRFLGETPPAEIPRGLSDSDLTDYLSGTAQSIAYVERRFGDAISYLIEGMTSVVEPQNRDRLAMDLMVLSGLVGDIDALLGAARTVSPQADPSTRLLAISATQLAEGLTLSTGSSEETYANGAAVALEDGVDPFLREQLEMSRVMVYLAEGRFDEANGTHEGFEDKTLLGSWLTIRAVIADAWLPLEQAAELALSAVGELEQFDPLANLAQARIVADLRQAQLGRAMPNDRSTAALEQGVLEIDRIMNQRVDAWLTWSEGDAAASKRLIEVGREAIAMGHRFWGLCALIDATRLGAGNLVAADIDHLIITRGAGLAVLAGGHARAETPAEYLQAAQGWWESGGKVYALEAALAGAAGGDTLAGLAVRVMQLAGVQPVVDHPRGGPAELSTRQLEIVVKLFAGMSNEEIGESLYISKRTVENHLYRLYKTLALAGGREELIERLGWLGKNE